MTWYLPFVQHKELPDEIAYRAFGIAAIQHFHKVSVVPDITPRWQQIARLALCCTAGQLDPDQLQDVAEDWAVQ